MQGDIRERLIAVRKLCRIWLCPCRGAFGSVEVVF